MLANLLMVTRSASEIASHDEAAEWVGLTNYTPAQEALSVRVYFDNPEDRASFLAKLGVALGETTKTMWWPMRERKDDIQSVRVGVRESDQAEETRTDGGVLVQPGGDTQQPTGARDRIARARRRIRRSDATAGAPLLATTESQDENTEDIPARTDALF